MLPLARPKYLEATTDPLLGIFSDRAGVQEHDVGPIRVPRQAIPLLAQYRRDDFGVRYVHLASVRLQVNLVVPFRLGSRYVRVVEIPENVYIRYELTHESLEQCRLPKNVRRVTINERGVLGNALPAHRAENKIPSTMGMTAFLTERPQRTLCAQGPEVPAYRCCLATYFPIRSYSTFTRVPTVHD